MALVGPGAPYVTPDILTTSTTGIAWGSIPTTNATPQQKQAAIYNICEQATTEVDEECRVPIRATINTETLHGPGDTYRFQVLSNGISRLVLSRPPVVSVISATSGNSRSFPTLTSAIAVNQFKIEYPLLDVYGTTAPGTGGDSGGQSVLMAPGIVNRVMDRKSKEITVTYLNGWPHASLTADVAAGATSLPVDDVCGWTGANGVVRSSYNQETVMVTSTTPGTVGALNGPGMLRLNSGLGKDYKAGTLVTTVPYTIIEAAILFAVNKALLRGSTAIVTQSANANSVSISGSRDSNSTNAKCKLKPYRRTL